MAFNSTRLESLRTTHHRPLARRIESQLVEVLVNAGFVEVVTPLVVSGESLRKMGISEDSRLWRQVYALQDGRFLRPMLAPNLYSLISRLQSIWPLPLRVFEVGPCFRRESSGGQHISEFTMLNLVELNHHPEPSRLEELIEMVLAPLNLHYELTRCESEVYSNSTDAEVNGLEVASGSVGPLPIDAAWGWSHPWVGWGVGIERLCIALEQSGQIHRFGRSLVYLDGARLNIRPRRTT